ncbi:MAG: NUDIX domain-containing protein [Candidatus Thorarchaeota archaeon]|nr:NUDIX domain-containing protein [Candidatus Thorarchaeota archaeon]
MERRYPPFPIPGVGGIVVGPLGVLMTTRDKDPGKGLWSIPGGAVEVGESQQEALVREVKEETGVNIEVLKLLDTYDVILRDAKDVVEYHFLLNHYLCRALSFDLHPESPNVQVGWFALDAIPAEESHPAIVALLKKFSSEIVQIHNGFSR